MVTSQSTGGPSANTGGAPPAGKAVGDKSTPDLIDEAEANGELDLETAARYLALAFTAPDRLPARYQSAKPWRGTLPLLKLRAALPRLRAGAARSDVEQALAGTSCGGSSLPYSLDTTHFHILYDASLPPRLLLPLVAGPANSGRASSNAIGGGLSVDHYASALETTWATEVDGFGWAAPPGGLYTVVITDIGSTLYGYVAQDSLVGNNPSTPWNDVYSWASCMVLNSNYLRPNFPSPPLASLQATVAHEFNHSIQFGLGALNGSISPYPAFVEACTTWMEDEVFDNSNDNYYFLWPVFNRCLGQFNGGGYANWITFRALTERFGTGVAGGGEQVMQDMWEDISKRNSGLSTSASYLESLNKSLVNKGTNLADAMHAYAIAVKFNRACGGGYVYPYCLKEGPAYVALKGPTGPVASIPAIGASYTGGVADNYSLDWVSLPSSGSPYSVSLQNTSTGGLLRASIVCDTGSALLITAVPGILGAGSTGGISNYDPNGCSSVVAAITNEAQTNNPTNNCTARTYLLSLSAPRGSATEFFHLIGR